MTREFILNEMRQIIKAEGVNGFYIYFETPIEMSDGTLINEINVGNNSVRFLEAETNKACNHLSKKDILRIYDNL